MIRRLLPCLTALLLLATGCGDDSTGTDAGPGAGTDAGPGGGTDAGPGGGTDAGPGGEVDAGDGTTDGGAGGVDGGGGGDAGPPSDTDPSMAGSHTVTESSDSVSRAGRTIPVQAYVPDGAGPFPLVTFGPGFQLESRRYAALCEHVATHGFVVVRADPPARLLSVSHVDMRDDMIAVIDWAVGELPVEASRVGVMGHSLGGKVATMVAGMDARVRALLGIDPVNGGMPGFGGTMYTASLPDVVPAVTGTLTIPVGYIGETTNSSGGLGGMACAPADENFQTFYDGSTMAGWAAEWDFEGADHMDFVEDTTGCGFTCTACTAGSADPATVQANTRTLAAAFFLRHLRSRPLDAWLTGAMVPSGIATRSR